MGLFDFFKKNGQKPEQVKETPKLDPQDQILDMNSFMPAAMEKKFEQKAMEHKKRLDNALKRNPAAIRFKVSERQTSLNIDEIELFDFYKILDKTFVVFDLETTGLNEHMDSIIEIAAVRVRDGKITETYQQLINPGFAIPSNITAINHITDSMVKDQPRMEDVLGDFLVFVNDDILVAHNAHFDIKFLAQACMANQYRCPDPFFDSMKISVLYPESKSKKLSALLECAGIQNNEAHRALGDSIALASLLLSSENRLMEWVNNNVTPDYSIAHCTEKLDPIDGALAGLRFCVTGYIEGYERYDFEKLILLHSGKATVRISNVTDYLIVGSYPDMPKTYRSRKEIYAEELIKNGGKIKVIKPDDLFAMINKE